MAKAAPWANTDAQARKRGEQTGLDTLVVHALNDVDWVFGKRFLSTVANA
jgi:uridylate kinase